MDAALEDVEATLSTSDLKGQNDECGGNDTPQKNLFKNWPLMSSIIVYCIFSLHDMAYIEVLHFV